MEIITRKTQGVISKRFTLIYFLPWDIYRACKTTSSFLRDSISSSFQSYAKKCKYIIICDKVFLQSKKLNSLVTVGGLFSGATVSAALFSCKRFDSSSDTRYPVLSDTTYFPERTRLDLILTYSFSDPGSMWHNRADILYSFLFSHNYILIFS